MGWYTPSGRYVETYKVALVFESNGEEVTVTREVHCSGRDEALVEAALQATHYSEYSLVSAEVALKYGH